jgi:hypothetical protein
MSIVRLCSVVAAAVLLMASSAAYVTFADKKPTAETPAPFGFDAEVRGDLTTRISGAAEFGEVPPGPGTRTFSLSLGARDSGGAVVFTRTKGGPLAPGSYVVREDGEGSRILRALVVTGSPSRPTGAFRAWWGWLTVTSASDSVMTGTFCLFATGFRALDPGNEDRRIRVTGSFTAVRGSA